MSMVAILCCWAVMGPTAVREVVLGLSCGQYTTGNDSADDYLSMTRAGHSVCPFIGGAVGSRFRW